MTVLLRGRFAPHVHAALSHMLTRTSVSSTAPLAVFDWDNTCINGDIGEAVLHRLNESHAVGCVQRYHDLCRPQDKTVGYKYCAEVLGGQSTAAADALIDDVIATCLADGTIAPRPEIDNLMACLRAHGWEVWVVTASAERIVRRFAPRYSVPVANVIGMVLREDGAWLTSELVGPITYRQGKVDAIEARIGRAPLFAAGDAMTDLEMLQAAQHALLFDRGDSGLLAHAHDRGWWVQAVF